MTAACAVCALPAEEHDRAWDALQQAAGETGAAAQGIALPSVTADALRRHFGRCSWVQPPPARPLRPARALRAVQARSPRERDVLQLCAQWRAVSAHDIARVLFWDGAAATWDGARSRVYRELKRLQLHDLLFRTLPRVGALPGAREPALWSLGRDGGPWAAGVTGVPRGRLSITASAQLGSSLDQWVLQGRSAVLAAICVELRAHGPVDPLAFVAAPHAHVDVPGLGPTAVPARGSVTDRHGQTLPVVIWADDGIEPQGSVARAVADVAAARAVVVVAPTAARVMALRASAPRGAGAAAHLVVVTTRSSLAHAPTRPVWRPLWAPGGYTSLPDAL